MKRFLLTALTAVLLACNQGGDQQPAAPTTPEAPAHAPTAGEVSAQSCTLPPGGGDSQVCPRQSPEYLEAVEASLDQLIREHPEIFDLNDGGPCGTCYRVKDEHAYQAGVVRNLQARGFCAVGGEEFGVKRTNEWNEQYDLLTAEMYIRRQLGSYRATCYPAAF